MLIECCLLPGKAGGGSVPLRLAPRGRADETRSSARSRQKNLSNSFLGYREPLLYLVELVVEGSS